MATNPPISARGLMQDVFATLTNEWQSAAIIGCQVAVPPDAIARSRREGNGKGNIVTRKLYDLVRARMAEKKKFGYKYKYRLAQPNCDND